LTFQDAQFRLLTLVRERIHNGELTERGLARRIGISQPHAHNVLKGVRNLSPEIFDSLLRYLHLSLLDLAPDTELEVILEKRRTLRRRPQIPFLASRIGPGLEWPRQTSWQERFPLPFPASIARPTFVMARLKPDPEMRRTTGGYGVAILDLSDRSRNNVSPGGLYVIEREGEALLRFVRQGSRDYYLLSDLNQDLPEQWQRIEAPAGAADFIRARVFWLGRETDRSFDQAGLFLLPAISW
jgi:transcriptional regulator with XRE-family HTH domain